MKPKYYHNGEIIEYLIKGNILERCLFLVALLQT